METGLLEMLESMGWTARGVMIVLAIMSVWSIGIAIERWLTFSKARKESRTLAPYLARCLKEGRVKDAIDASMKNRHSHLAKVLVAGLQEFQFQEGDVAVDFDMQIESAKRALQRATVIGTQEFKRGLNGLATIGSTAPFVGLFGTVAGIINCFKGMALTGSGGLGAVSAGIAEALVTTGFGLFVAIPAVWFFNYFLNKIEVFGAEMDNSSAELLNYFLKKKAAA
ncbi:MAG: MotA/TolQ/ExbB proton channel family protein [Acidobacteriota bacterium]